MFRAIEGLKNKEFDRIIISKPIREVLGNSVGFLPGLDEKFKPYLKSFYDIVNIIVGKNNSN